MDASHGCCGHVGECVCVFMCHVKMHVCVGLGVLDYTSLGHDVCHLFSSLHPPPPPPPPPPSPPPPSSPPLLHLLLLHLLLHLILHLFHHLLVAGRKYLGLNNLAGLDRHSRHLSNIS